MFNIRTGLRLENPIHFFVLRVYSFCNVFMSCMFSERTFNDTTLIYRLRKTKCFFLPIAKAHLRLSAATLGRNVCVFLPPPTAGKAAKQTQHRHSCWSARHLAPSSISPGCQRAWFNLRTVWMISKRESLRTNEEKRKKRKNFPRVGACDCVIKRWKGGELLRQSDVRTEPAQRRPRRSASERERAQELWWRSGGRCQLPLAAAPPLTHRENVTEHTAISQLPQWRECFFCAFFCAHIFFFKRHS